MPIAFRYRCTRAEPLTFLCMTMPRWTGDQEATAISAANRLADDPREQQAGHE